jgi:acyl-coenzyme A synthetase/AMP-(fatty) acid ligase
VSDWGWVTAAYLIVYGTLIVYTASLVVRTRRARAEADRR